MCVGIKCAFFDTKSITIITVSQLEDLGSSTIKLTLSISQYVLETKRGYNSSTGECLVGLVYKHRL